MFICVSVEFSLDCVVVAFRFVFELVCVYDFWFTHALVEFVVILSFLVVEESFPMRIIGVFASWTRGVHVSMLAQLAAMQAGNWMVRVALFLVTLQDAIFRRPYLPI